MSETPKKNKPIMEAPYSAGTPSTGYQRPPPELHRDPTFRAAAAATSKALVAAGGEVASGLVAGASAHRNISAEFGKAGFKEPSAPSFRNIRQFFTSKPGRKPNNSPPTELQGGKRKRSRRARRVKKTFKK